MPTTHSKGFIGEFLLGETGWDDEMNANLRRANALTLDEWAHEPLTTVGLAYGYRGGIIWTGDVISKVPSGSVLVTASNVNYVERDAAGTVTANIVGWTSGRTPMAVVTTGVSAVTGVEDWRTYQSKSATALASMHRLRVGPTDIAPASADAFAVNGEGFFRLDRAALTAVVVHNQSSNAAASASLYVKNDAVQGGVSSRNNGVAREIWFGTETAHDVRVMRANAAIAAFDATAFFAQIADSYDLGSSLQRWRDAHISRYVLVGTPPGGAQGIRTETGVSSREAGYTLTNSDGSVQGLFSLPGTYTRIGSTTAHRFTLMSNNVDRWDILSAGHFTAVDDATYDIGEAADNRPRDLHLSRNAVAGGRGTFAGLTATRQSQVAPQSITANTGATNIDLSLSNNHEVSMESNTTFSVSNGVAGSWHTIFLKPDATGSRVPTFPGTFEWPQSVTPGFTTTPAKTDTIFLYVKGDGNYRLYLGGLNQ
jgi:hypothetical protein